MKSLRAAHTDGDEQNANDSQQPADDLTTSTTAVSFKAYDSGSNITSRNVTAASHSKRTSLHKTESPPEQHWQRHYHQQMKSPPPLKAAPPKVTQSSSLSD